jgi:formate dehydrogenase subunit delta
MTVQRLVYMANQIATFFAAEARDKAVAATADHLHKFWDPRMRMQILAHLAEHRGEGLSPVALAAVQGLATEAGTPEPAS